MRVPTSTSVGTASRRPLRSRDRQIADPPPPVGAEVTRLILNPVLGYRLLAIGYPAQPGVGRDSVEP